MVSMNCPICGAEPLVVRQIGEVTEIEHPCRCQVEHWDAYTAGMQLTYRALGSVSEFMLSVPARFREATLENYVVTPDVAAEHRQATQLAPGELVYLFGPAGSGKTHMAVGLAKRLVSMTGQRAYFISDLDLHRKTMNAWTAKMLPPDFTQYDILVIDDFGKSGDREHSARIFVELLDHYYAEQKTLILTSNLDVLEGVGRFAVHGQHQVAMLSRLTQGRMLELVSEKDYRTGRSRPRPGGQGDV